MSGLTEDMARLRDEIGALRASRSQFIKDLKYDVGELKVNVADFLADSHKYHMEAGRATRRDLMEFTSLIKNQIAALKEEVAQMQMNFFKGHTDMADNMKNRLHVYISEIKKDVADLLSVYREDRKEMSRETKEKLMESMVNIKEYVADLANNVAEMMSGFKEDHIDVARKGKKERKAFLSGLAEDVADIHRDIGRLRNVFAEDISGAHRAWSGLRPAARRMAKEDVKKEKPPAKEKHIADDFTQIHGIGPGTQERLNKGGIFTFMQLAKCQPEEIRRMIGKSGRATQIDKWIGQARKLADKSSGDK